MNMHRPKKNIKTPPKTQKGRQLSSLNRSTSQSTRRTIKMKVRPLREGKKILTRMVERQSRLTIVIQG
jgi:hypothetical protein